MPFFHKLIASGFGTGYSPIAPGTCGAIFALLIWWGYAAFIDNHDILRLITMGIIFLFTILGIWSSNIAEQYWGKDPSRIVVDEMVGTWITLLAVSDKTQWGYIMLRRLHPHAKMPERYSPKRYSPLLQMWHAVPRKGKKMHRIPL